MELRGATVLVTGAGRRLGRVVALALAAAGAHVVLHVHSSDPGELIDEIDKGGGRASIVKADLGVPGEAERLAQDVLDIGPVDVLVNSAAVFFPTLVYTLTVEEWRKVMQVNMTAPVTLATVLGQEMKRRRRGKIIQLGDWSGQRPVCGYLPYCVAKGGLHVATVALAKALAPHVQVNEIVLGPVLPPSDYDVSALDTLTRATPLARLGEPSAVIRTVRFLIEEGDFVTGASYVVDGGWLAQAPGGMKTSL